MIKKEEKQEKEYSDSDNKKYWIKALQSNNKDIIIFMHRACNSI